MYLKRKYDAAGKIGLKVLHCNQRQRFTPRLLRTGQQEGWLRICDGRITLTGQGGTSVSYRVERVPGIYCCFCERQFSTSDEARAHMVIMHPIGVSPDRQNPAGYRVDGFFDCIRL